jgi:hypothetical protein
MCRSRFPRRPPNVGGGLDAPRALLPALLAVAPVMWASQDATVPLTDAEAGPIALGSPLLVATGCRASRSVKRSKEGAGNDTTVPCGSPVLGKSYDRQR